jgi:hypothetical protein
MYTTARFGADTLTETAYGKLRGNILLHATTGGNASIRYAFIEWNNFTMGHTDTFFIPDGAANTFNGAVGDWGGIRNNLLGYTAEFNDSVSASISIESHDAVDGGDAPSGVVLSPLAVNNDSTQLPDLVGNIVGKGDWGKVFVSGAIGNYRTVEAAGGAEDSFMGWALGFGGTANLDFITKGDQLQAKFGYTDGAFYYLGGNFRNAIVDTTGGLTTGIETASGWTAQGSFLHNWSPTINSTLFGGYAAVDYNTNLDTAAVIENRTKSGWNIGGNLQWVPVDGMVIGTEIAYGNATWGHDGAPDTSGDGFSGLFRAQRNF